MLDLLFIIQCMCVFLFACNATDWYLSWFFRVFFILQFRFNKWISLQERIRECVCVLTYFFTNFRRNISGEALRAQLEKQGMIHFCSILQFSFMLSLSPTKSHSCTFLSFALSRSRAALRRMREQRENVYLVGRYAPLVLFLQGDRRHKKKSCAQAAQSVRFFFLFCF